MATPPAPSFIWRYAGVNRNQPLAVRGRFRTDDKDGMLQAALGGLGFVILVGASAMIEMVYHLQLNAALGPEMTFMGASINAKGLTSWFGAAFVMLTGLGMFELCRRQFLHQWGQIQEQIEHDIKRGEAL